MIGDYAELGVYIFFLGLIVQSLYRIFDPLLVGIKNTFIKLLRLIRILKPEKKKIAEPQDIFYDREGRVSSPDIPSYKVDEGSGHYNPVEDISVGREFADYRDRKPIEDKPTWQDLTVPPLIGLGVAWIFYPASVFDYLPFQPQYPIAAYIITALVISRIANAEHDTFKRVGEFFIGLTGKLFYR